MDKGKGGGQGRNGPSAKKKKSHHSLQKQIRDLKRLLSNEGLDNRAKREIERRIETISAAHEQNKRSELERKFAVRYHKAKFFERVKIERSIDKLQREITKDPSRPTAVDSKRLAQLKEDLQYVLHFPKGEKFVSLLKQADNPTAQAELEKQRSRLRELVRKQLADEALLAETDEGLHQSKHQLASPAQVVEQEENAPPHKFPDILDGEPAVKTKKQKTAHQPQTVQIKTKTPLVTVLDGGQLETGTVNHPENDLRAEIEEQPVGNNLAFDDDFFLAPDEDGHTTEKANGGNGAQPGIDSQIADSAADSQVPPKSNTKPSKWKEKPKTHTSGKPRNSAKTGHSKSEEFRSKSLTTPAKLHAKNMWKKNYGSKDKSRETSKIHAKPERQNKAEISAIGSQITRRTRAEGGRKRRKKK